MVLNVCEVFAPTKEKALEARADWIARGETLDLMYENIHGLQGAALEVKNYIYDALVKKVRPLVMAAVREGVL